MDLNSYRFRSVWRVPAPREAVYRVLEELAEYPRWWPEIRRSERVDDQTYELTCRSLLPYDLTFTTTQQRTDPDRGLLEASMAGDLEGFSRWTMREDLNGTRLMFTEVVIANKALLRRLAFVARPAFTANHALMMRHGQQGLRTYLAGYTAGRRAEAIQA